MATWKGKTRGGVAGYQFFLFLLKYPGLKFSYFFLRFVVLYFVFFAPQARKPIFSYFRHILGFSYLKSVYYIFKNFYKLGQVLLDKVAMLGGFSNKFTFDFDGEEHIRQMAANEGGLLIGAHIGNWEIAGQLLDRIDTKVHVLMLEAEHEKIKVLLDSVMTKKTFEVIAIKEDLSHLLLIKDALQNNEIVAMHGDRFIAGSKTTFAKFFGHEAEFPIGPFYLALKYSKQVSFVSAVKQTDTHYFFHATKPALFGNLKDRKQGEKFIHQMLGEYIKEMERMLLKFPEQWFNYYYFWGPQK